MTKKRPVYITDAQDAWLKSQPHFFSFSAAVRALVDDLMKAQHPQKPPASPQEDLAHDTADKNPGKA